MKRFHRLFAVCVVIGLACMIAGTSMQCSKKAEDTKAPAVAKEASEQELTARVPELLNLHKVIYPLWHDAYPTRNVQMIKSLIPRADSLVAALDNATLPGILKDKKPAWDKAKAHLDSVMTGLHAAVAANDPEGILKKTEEFHAAYEGLALAIQPMVPELEDFHRELYKLYHYYLPEYDLAKIRESSQNLAIKMAPLKVALLPKRIANRQDAFKVEVNKLEAAVNELNATVKTDAKENIKAAVEKVHTQYQKTAQVFD